MIFFRYLIKRSSFNFEAVEGEEVWWEMPKPLRTNSRGGSGEVDLQLFFYFFLSKIFLLLPNHLLIENNQSAASGSTEESVVDSGESSSPSSYHFHRIIFVTFNPCYHHQLYTYVMSFSTVSVLVGFVLPFLAVQDSSIGDLVTHSLINSLTF